MAKEKSAAFRLASTLIFVVAVPTMSGCVSATQIEVTELPARIDYVCVNNRTLSVERMQSNRSAMVMVEGKPIVLPQTGSATQEKYSDGRFTLYIDGEKALLEDIGRVIYGPCKSSVPLPKSYRQ